MLLKTHTKLLLFIIVACVNHSCKKRNLDGMVESTSDISYETPDVELADIGSLSEALEGELLYNQNKSENINFTKRAWQGIPSIVSDDNGILFAAWYSGGKGEGPGNYIVVSISKDRGKSWIQNSLIINPTNDAVRFFDPTLWKDKYGTIFLSWSKSKGLAWDGKGGVWYSKIRYGDSIIATVPRRLADGVMMNKPTSSYDKKKTYYSIAVWNLTKNPDKQGIDLYSSVYNEKLKKSSDFNKAGTISFKAELRNFDEHQILQLSNGSFIGFIRGIDGIYITKSENDINSWQTPTKFTPLGPTTASRFFLGQLESGKIALVFNNSNTRNSMKIFLSEDEGKSWKYSMLLDNRENISYPDLTQDNEGNIYIVYDRDRFGTGEINCIILKEDDIVKNATASIQKYIIDKKR